MSCNKVIVPYGVCTVFLVGVSDNDIIAMSEENGGLTIEVYQKTCQEYSAVDGEEDARDFLDNVFGEDAGGKLPAETKNVAWKVFAVVQTINVFVLLAVIAYVL